MRIKNGHSEIDSLDNCWDCHKINDCNFLKKLKEISKGIQVIIIQYCSKEE